MSEHADTTYDPLTATDAELRAHGERRISATRANVERCGAELRAEIDRLYEAERTLAAEVRRLTDENRELRSHVSGSGVVSGVRIANREEVAS